MKWNRATTVEKRGFAADIDVSEYARLCRVDARMDALISYINAFEHSTSTGKPLHRPFSKDEVKAIIGMCDE